MIENLGRSPISINYLIFLFYIHAPQDALADPPGIILLALHTTHGGLQRSQGVILRSEANAFAVPRDPVLRPWTPPLCNDY